MADIYIYIYIYQRAAVHIQAQTIVELDCIVDLVFRGSDQHVAITTSITNSIALSIMFV